MKKSILAPTLALTAGLFVSPAMAVIAPSEVDGGTVNFSGNLISAACTIVVGSENQTVDLGSVDLDVMHTWTDMGPNRDFTISLENCDSAVSQNVQAAFTGASSGGNVLDNTATVSPSNAVLALRDVIGTLMPLDGSYHATAGIVAITNGAMSVTYSANYWPNPTFLDATAGNTLYPVTYKLKYF